MAVETGLARLEGAWRALAEAKTPEEAREARKEIQRAHIQRFVEGDRDAFYDLFSPFLARPEEAKP